MDHAWDTSREAAAAPRALRPPQAPAGECVSGVWRRVEGTEQPRVGTWLFLWKFGVSGELRLSKAASCAWSRAAQLAGRPRPAQPRKSGLARPGEAPPSSEVAPLGTGLHSLR